MPIFTYKLLNPITWLRKILFLIFIILRYHFNMARQSRILLSNGHYHIFNRSNNRHTINLIDHTYDYFLNLLEESKSKFNLKFYAYCLMKNHYHICVKTLEPNLHIFMKYFAENYAKYINKITNGSGPVFSGRYKSKIILDEQYLFQVIRYIHLNPVNSSSVLDFKNYLWSSFNDYSHYKFNIIDQEFFNLRFRGLDDFYSYHQLGNSKDLTYFYNRKNSPTKINTDTVDLSK